MRSVASSEQLCNLTFAGEASFNSFTGSYGTQAHIRTEHRTFETVVELALEGPCPRTASDLRSSRFSRLRGFVKPSKLTFSVQTALTTERVDATMGMRSTASSKCMHDATRRARSESRKR